MCSCTSREAGSRKHLLCGRGSEREHRHAWQLSPRHRLHILNFFSFYDRCFGTISTRSSKEDRESAAPFLAKLPLLIVSVAVTTTSAALPSWPQKLHFRPARMGQQRNMMTEAHTTHKKGRLDWTSLLHPASWQRAARVCVNIHTYIPGAGSWAGSRGPSWRCSEPRLRPAATPACACPGPAAAPETCGGV